MNGFDNFLINLHNPQLFRRIVNRLMAHKYGEDYVSPDDDRADNGNDGYVTSKKRQHAVHCFKKDPYSDAKVLTKARSDLAKASKLKSTGRDIEEWAFITAYRLSDDILATLTSEATAVGFRFTPLGPDNLAALLGQFSSRMQDIPEVALVVKVRDSALSLAGGDASGGEFRLDLGTINKIPVSQDDEQFRTITALMRQGKATVKENEQLLKDIYHTGKTLHSRLQAGFALISITEYSEDNVGDAITLVDSLIGTATMIGDTASLANLHAERGKYITRQFVELDLHASSSIEGHNIFGISAYSPTELSEVETRLRNLEDEYSREFSEALRITYETNDWRALAYGLWVLVFRPG